MENESNFQRLLSPFKIKGVEIKNRVVFLPHEMYYGSEEHLPTKKIKYYYEERAKGGAGLIIMPSIGVHPSGYYACEVAAKPESLPMMKEITETVHKQGSKIFAQFTHYGNQTKSIETLQPMWAPSAVPDMTVREIPKEMTVDEIHILIKAFADAANLLQNADFDGFEIKVAHDGILRQFLSPATNIRTDDYGGSLEKRARVVVEVLQEMRKNIGNKPLGIRLCIDEATQNGYTLNDGIEYAKIFAPLVDYINVDYGNWESMEQTIPSLNYGQGLHIDAISKVKKAVNVPVIASGRIIRPEMAENILENQVADLIGMARELIAEPYWVEKVKGGDLEEITECIGCNQKCIGRLLQNRAISCVVNPAAGFEEDYSRDKMYSKAKTQKKVVVIGGGPAGMKAAEIAARKGHQVVLFEKNDELGGRVNLESSLPEKQELGGTARYLKYALRKLNVDVRINSTADVNAVLGEKPDITVVATGSVLTNQEGTYSVKDVIEGKVTGENVLVMDFDANIEGTGAVEHLANLGKTVHWVSPTFFNGQDNEVSTVLLPIYRRLGTKKVMMHPMSVMIQFENGKATLLNPYTNTISSVDGIDAIVMAGTKAANNSLYKELNSQLQNVYVIGDAAAPRNTGAALADAMSVSMNF